LPATRGRFAPGPKRAFRGHRAIGYPPTPSRLHTGEIVDHQFGAWRHWIGACLIGLWLAGLGAGAVAASDPPARAGFYAAAAGSYALNASDLRLDLENSLGLKARLGHRFQPRWALEAEFEWINEFDVRINDSVPASYGVWALTANARGYLMTGRIQPFVLAGLGVAHASFRDRVGTLAGAGFPRANAASGFALRFGGGAEIHITRHIAIILDASYLMASGDLDDFDYASLGWGVQYRF